VIYPLKTLDYEVFYKRYKSTLYIWECCWLGRWLVSRICALKTESLHLW